MHDVQYYKSIFDKYGGMMRTTQLAEEKIFYPQREKLIADGYVEKIRRGYYQWIDPDDFSEVRTVIHLFPDAILCMDTALRITVIAIVLQAIGIWQSAKTPANPDLKLTIPS